MQPTAAVTATGHRAVVCNASMYFTVPMAGSPSNWGDVWLDIGLGVPAEQKKSLLLVMKSKAMIMQAMMMMMMLMMARMKILYKHAKLHMLIATTIVVVEATSSIRTEQLPHFLHHPFLIPMVHPPQQCLQWIPFVLIFLRTRTVLESSLQFAILPLW